MKINPNEKTNQITQSQPVAITSSGKFPSPKISLNHYQNQATRTEQAGVFLGVKRPSYLRAFVRSGLRTYYHDYGAKLIEMGPEWIKIDKSEPRTQNQSNFVLIVLSQITTTKNNTKIKIKLQTARVYTKKCIPLNCGNRNTVREFEMQIAKNKENQNNLITIMKSECIDQF